MMERHSKKELTRLILTALILAGGSFYGTVAEAVTIESTDTKTTLEGKGFTVGTYNDVPLIGYQTNGTELTINGVPADYTGYNMAGFYSNTNVQVKNNNKVIVCGGTMKGVFGAYGAAGATTNNTVEINATTNDITITGVIVGAGSGSMTAQYVSGNTVTISGDSSKLHLADAIVYGATGHGNEFVQDNKVNINTGVTLKGIIGATEYSEGFYSYPNGNVLNLGATGITVTGTGTVEGVQGFETIKIGYTDTNSQFHNVSFADGGTVLSVTGNVLYSNSPNVTGTITLDISGATGLTGETSKVGTMTLVSASNSLADMKLKYSSAAAATIPSNGVKVNSDMSTHNSTANNINLAYTYDHTVKLANSNTSIQYNIANNVTKVTPDGAIDWSNGGTVRALTDTTYTFGSGTAIDMSNLTFTSTAVDHNPLSESMTLLSGATGITGGSITQPGDGKGTIAANFTDTAGINFVGTAKGTVSVGTGNVLYTLNSGTLTSIDLGNWNGTASNIPTNWTGTNVAVATGNFASEPTTNVDIFTTSTAGFFNDTYITGAKKYSGGTELVNDTAKGVTLTGYKGGGVKATDSGKKLSYFKEMMDTQSITLGQMTWGQGRTAASGDNFANIGNGEIDATNLTFTNPTAATGSMDLLSGATDLAAGLTIVNPNHSQNFTGSAATNGATLDGTITGTVATAAEKITYTVGTKNITGIDLAGWNGTFTALDGWTANLGADSIKAEGFTAPTLTAGTETNIFTTSAANFFDDNYITGAQKYGASTAPSSDTANGVTFTGNQQKGVKASTDGKNLVYAVGNMAVSNIALGNMAVGNTGVVTPRTATGNYTFNGSTTIDATNLKFDNPADVADSTLVTSATGITSSNSVTGASHSQAITNAAMGGGITASGTLHGTVEADTNAVKYTVTDKTVSSMDLSGWDGTTTVNGLPNNKWTGSNVAVSTGTFTAPTTDKTIFTTNIGDFFGDVTGAMAYTSGAAFSGDEGNGVTLSGTKSGGVKKSDDGKNLNFIAEARTVNNIALGNMDWGTGRAITGNYDFSTVANNGVDASGLNFNFTGDTVNTISSSTPVWNLVTDATGLNGSLTVKGSPVSQTVSYGINNVANLTGTLTGDVTTANDTVQYKVTGKTLDKVDISNWDGSTVNTALNTSWSKKDSGITVTGSGFTKPTTYGDHTILTATNANFFTGAKIDSSIAYNLSGSYSETEQNITLSGKQAGGVLANGSSLVYKVGTASIDTIKLGKVTYAKGTVLLNKSDTNLYNYSNVNSLDKSSFVMSMTDEQKKAAKANDSMTLVQANNTLKDIAAQEASKGSYTYANTSATSDLTVKGTVTGNVAAASSNVIYTVASNTASALTINSVTWGSSGTYARPDSEIAYRTALVNADNITFTGVDTLSKNDTMVLVSNYGVKVNEEVNKVRGGIFTLSNGKTGKGHAYYDSATDSLVYVVDRGVDDEVETKTAIGTKTIIINEQPHQGDVPGGEAEGDGEAKDNETIIKKSHIKKNTDGTGGDANGGTSEDGDADENKLDIEESEIDGDATGGQSDTGNTDDNETIIKKSIIHGGVAGGETLGGHGGSRRNKTTVEDSTVEGDVDGGKTGGDGETKENEVVITGSSKIGGDVNGGHSGGDGDSSGNEVTVDNSTVDGDVNGGKSDGDGNTKNNKVDIKKGSKIGGSVHGGHSGGSGNSTGNEVTVDCSEVDGNVMGGRTKDGNANNNTVNIDGGSTINGSVYGGYSDTGDASGNNVNIGTGKINGDIYGGYSGGTGSTINNTVTLYGDADVSNSNIIGGSNGSTGNTLNIGKGTESWTGGGQTVKNISSFDTLNFTALPWNSDTPALTIGDGSATDLSNTTVTAQQVAFTGVKTISVGSTMMFLDQSNVAAGKKATNINSGSDFTVGTAMEGTGKLVLDANGNVIYQVETAGVSRQTHNTVMAAEAAVVALNAGNDFILSAREGLARKENIGKDGVAVYAKIGGGATRQETGSHVNVNMWNGIVAVGRKNVQKESTTEYGVFVEHGWGNFSTHSDNAQRGDGSVDYTGGGLLGKWTKADGLYVEGSLRIGSMHEKANNLLRDTVRGYGYDERTTYKGFHLGVGKEFAIKDGNTVEVYGKYFYNRKDGMNFNAGLDEYNLDAVTSQILRVGARYTMKRERWNYYGDLSYEHELDGQAKGHANGMAIRGADTSGGSVRLELGAKLLANEKSPWTLDLNLTGYAGKKQGLQGGVSVKFMF